LDRPAKAERIEHRLLPEDGFPALEAGDTVGILVEKEEWVVWDVPGQEPVLAQEADGQAGGAQRGSDGAGLGPCTDRQPWNKRVRDPAGAQVGSASHGPRMVGEQGLLRDARQDR